MNKLIISTNKRTIANETSFKQYMNDVNNYPIMTKEEEFHISVSARKGNKEALNQLINSNLRFVISVAKQYVDSKHSIEDLVNEGNIGLIIAAKKFDPNKNFKFISYAVWWIRREIQAYKSGDGELIKKPINQVNYLNKYKKISNKLTNILERTPTHEEIINEFEFNDTDLMGKLNNETIHSMDKPYGANSDITLNDILSNPDTINNKFDSDNLKYKLKGLFNRLNEKEQKIIEMSYGLNNNLPMTLEEIGDSFNLTKEAIRLIKNKALLKLKECININNLNYNDFII